MPIITLMRVGRDHGPGPHMNDTLRAALESYDADGYELVLLTPDSYAVICNAHETLVLGPAVRPTTMPALSPRNQRRKVPPPPPRVALLAVALLIVAVLAGIVLARVLWWPAPAAPTAPTTPTASPTAPPSPSPTDPVPSVLSGALPTDERVRMFVFAGGTTAELVAATRCETGMPVYWGTTDDGRFFAYSPRGEPRNPVWHGEFSQGIPRATALIGTCR